MSDRKDTARGVFQLLLGVVVIALAVGAFMFFQATKQEPAKQEIEERVALAEVTRVVPVSHPATIRANGVVSPAREVQISPQVAGRVAWISDSLHPGKIVREDDNLFRIDRTNYQLAVQRAQAQVDTAESQLEVERGRQRVAVREWELFADGSETEADSNPSLARREPQLRAAEVQLESAQAQLNQAYSDLTRTMVEAPFDAYVASRMLEVGAYASPQSPAARLVGIEKFWVEVSISPDLLPWLSFRETDGEGSSAVVRYDMGRTEVARDGVVLRLLQSLDPEGRMAKVLVEIEDPLRLAANAERGDNPEDNGLPLLIGAYVDVLIDGPDLDDVIAIPRAALRGGNTIWVVNDDSRMEIHQVDPVWTEPEAVYVRAGETLHAGDRLITTTIASPVQGLKIDARPTGSRATGQAASEGSQPGVADEDRDSTNTERSAEASEEAP